jgi:hypothetical protein
MEYRNYSDLKNLSDRFCGTQSTANLHFLDNLGTSILNCIQDILVIALQRVALTFQ